MLCISYQLLSPGEARHHTSHTKKCVSWPNSWTLLSGRMVSQDSAVHHTYLLVQHVRTGHRVEFTGLHEFLAHETQLTGSGGLGHSSKRAHTNESHRSPVIHSSKCPMFPGVLLRVHVPLDTGASCPPVPLRRLRGGPCHG